MKGKRCRLNKPKSSFGIYAILFPSNIDTGIDVQLQQYVCDFCKYSVNILHIFNAKKSFRFLIFYSKIGVRVVLHSNFTLWSNEFQGAQYVEEQRVPGRKGCLGPKCSREERVLRSKVCLEAKCSWEQNVLRSKVCLEAKCS